MKSHMPYYRQAGAPLSATTTITYGTAKLASVGGAPVHMVGPRSPIYCNQSSKNTKLRTTEVWAEVTCQGCKIKRARLKNHLHEQERRDAVDGQAVRVDPEPPAGGA